jgi:hypothetical protein
MESVKISAAAVMQQQAAGCPALREYAAGCYEGNRQQRCKQLQQDAENLLASKVIGA